jgi:hypothetical protein
MDNIFEIPREITSIDAIPISDIIQGLDNQTNSNLVNKTDANNLTEEQSLFIEDAIKRSEEQIEHSISTKETEWEMWSYDDFDNAYNNGITFQEKEAFTIWIENRLGTSQKGFFKRYSLQRSDQEVVNFREFGGEGTFEKIISLMRLGVLFWDVKTQEYVPKYIYTTNNLYEKRSLLSQNKMFIEEKFGEDVYLKHYSVLEDAFLKVYDTRIKLSGEDLDKCLKFDINSDMAKDIKIRRIVTSRGKQQNGSFMIAVANNSNAKEFDKGRSTGSGKKTETSFNEITLREGFMWWLRHSQVKESGGQGINLYGMTWQEIYNIYMLRNRKGLGSLTAQQRFQKREEALRVGKALWSDFMQRGVDGDTKLEIETIWNSKYNHNPNLWDEARCSYVDGDKRTGKKYTLSSGGEVMMVQGQVPIGFTMAKRYGGDKNEYINDIRTDKRRSLSYCTLTNYQSLLAYGVGVGKTWCAIFQVAQALELGLCKRPIFVLPNQVYPQFVKEIKSILPQYKINALFNLRGDIMDELKEQGGIQENTISVVTETALNVMGFSKGYAEDGFFINAYSTLSQTLNGKMSSKEVEKMEEDNREITSEQDKLGRDKVLIDKMKWDYLVVDEAHNYKKLVTTIIGKVIENPTQSEMATDDKEMQKEREKTNFQFGGGKPSGRALRMFYLTDYIQNFNKFGNTLLLTATPFTNNPLEVFSMMTYVDRNALRKTNIDASADFFKVFGNMGFNIEATIQGTIQEKFTFLGWMNVPALQNMLFNNIDFISADEIDLKRPNKIVLPFKSLLNGETNETRVLAREEQVSSIITMTEKQQELIETLKNYANGQIDWMPKLYERVVDREKDETILYPYNQDYIDEKVKTETFVASPDMWNTTSLIKDESKIKWLVGEHQVSKRKKVKILENYLNEAGNWNLKNGYTPEQIKEVGSFSDDTSTALLRSLTFQRQITISPYLYNASGDTEEPTAKEYVESSAKLKYVMGCIKSVQEHHKANNTAMSGQIIYMEYGIRAFPLIAQYLQEELGFEPQEVGIICGDKKMTRVMSSVGRDGKKPKPQHKSIVQNCFNGLIQLGNGDFDEMSDKQRCKVLIGSETISEGMNLQFKSSVIYQCFLPFNPTNQVQLEGRIWRQGNPYKFVRIVNPLCADSIDIFMFQKMQDKAKYINQIWNRNGQTFMIDAREFDPNELKEACISNPYQLAKFQTDEIKKEIQTDISKQGYEKTKYDNVKLMLDKSVLLQFGGFPSIKTDAQYEANQGKGGINFNTFCQSSSLFSLYQMLRTLRPDLIDKDIFSDSFYNYLAKMKEQVVAKYSDDEGNFEIGYNSRWGTIDRFIKIGEADLNYSLIEILELTRDFIKARKISLPIGFSKEALEDIVVNDKVRFVKRGQRYEGVVIDLVKDDDADFVVEVEADGRVKEIEVRERDNDVKKIVEVKKKKGKKDKEDSGVQLITWGTKQFVELLPLLQAYTSGNSEYTNMFKEYWNDQTPIPSLSAMPFQVDYAQLMAENSWHFRDKDDFFTSYKQNYDNDKKIRTLLNRRYLRNTKNSGGENIVMYEPTYLREVENAFSTFELQMKPQNINTITELNEKIESFGVEIERLNSELKNVGRGERIQERAQQIILKREQENAVKDQSLQEGDWKSRVTDFASLNCVLDMLADTSKKLKIVIEEKEVVDVEEVDLEQEDVVETTEETSVVGFEILDTYKMSLNYLTDENEKATMQNLIDDLELALKYS